MWVFFSLFLIRVLHSHPHLGVSTLARSSSDGGGRVVFVSGLAIRHQLRFWSLLAGGMFVLMVVVLLLPVMTRIQASASCTIEISPNLFASTAALEPQQADGLCFSYLRTLTGQPSSAVFGRCVFVDYQSIRRQLSARSFLASKMVVSMVRYFLDMGDEISGGSSV